MTVMLLDSDSGESWERALSADSSVPRGDCVTLAASRDNLPGSSGDCANSRLGRDGELLTRSFVFTAASVSRDTADAVGTFGRLHEIVEKTLSTSTSAK
jgi:hypothetical protein